MIEYGHTTVLLQESIDGLDFHPGDIFIDGTLGSAGHSEEVVKRFGSTVQIIGLDMDQDALKRAEKRFAKLDANATFVQSNFRNLDTTLGSLHIHQIHKMLLDIGLSSNQFEESGRGFTFKNDEPLLMTFKKDLQPEDLTAKTIVNEWS
ncbi:MAG: 16S rRNA (cytosine(1402)-N(4))-methyltransferase, partial [bacterium]|nr:16S rRNA (cytosine(1402)-N(4))-methyltransferase [bacterium]